MDSIQCSICLEEIVNEIDKTTIGCSHFFHMTCITKWYETPNIDSCPFCREIIREPYMYNFIETNSPYYKCKYKRKTKTIDGKDISFINNMLLNRFQIPISWIEINHNTISAHYLKKNKITKYLLPIYNIIFDNDIRYVSLYTRLFILYSSVDTIKLYKKNCLNGYSYYETDIEINSVINKNVIIICFEWVYDVLIELKSKYNMVYLSVINTFIFDLFMNTYLNMNEPYSNRTYVQAILICAIFNSIKTFENSEVNIELSEINYYGDNAYTLDDLKPFIEYQNLFIKKNIWIIK
jgi:hypothetical protein